MKPNIGDAFVKIAGRASHTWVVDKTFTRVDGILHVVLRRLDQRSEIITVSGPALADPSLFQPWSAA